MALFRPKAYINRYDEFDIEKYAKQGYKAVFLDVDNTIAIPSTGICDEDAEKFINAIKASGMIPVVFSNNNYGRVKRFVRDIDVRWTCFSLKPLPFRYWSECIKLGVKPKETIVMGDQLITDILGANLSGCYGVYTKRLVEKDSFFTSKTRGFEQFIWRKILHEKV